MIRRTKASECDDQRKEERLSRLKAERLARIGRARDFINKAMASEIGKMPPEIRDAVTESLSTFAGLIRPADEGIEPLLFCAFVSAFASGQLAEGVIRGNTSPESFHRSLAELLAPNRAKGTATNVRKGEATRERVEAEIAAAAARGEEIQVDVIAERLGVGRSTVYRHLR